MTIKADGRTILMDFATLADWLSAMAYGQTKESRNGSKINLGQYFSDTWIAGRDGAVLADGDRTTFFSLDFLLKEGVFSSYEDIEGKVEIVETTGRYGRNRSEYIWGTNKLMWKRSQINVFEGEGPFGNDADIWGNVHPIALLAHELDHAFKDIFYEGKGRKLTRKIEHEMSAMWIENKARAAIRALDPTTEWLTHYRPRYYARVAYPRAPRRKPRMGWY